jgi:hypothetical protein
MRQEGKMMLAQRYPRVSGFVYRGGAGLLLAGGVALLGAGLIHWHAAHYSVATFDLGPWLPSLLTFLVVVALLGASVGGWLYVRRQWRAGASRRLDNTLLVVGALLTFFNAPAALDLTVTPPVSMTGQLGGLGESISPFNLVTQYNIYAKGTRFTVTPVVYRGVYRSSSDVCVTIVYGPRSHIAYAVTLVAFSDLSEQQRFCGELTAGD